MAKSVSGGARLVAIGSVHIAALLFGLAGVIGAASGLGAMQVTFGRTFFAAGALGVVLLYTRSGTFKSQQLYSPLLLLSGALLAFHWVIFFASINASTVAIGLVTFSICTVFIAVLEPWFFKERFQPAALVAAFIVLVGVVIISGVYRGELYYPRGIALGLASAFSFAVLQLVNRKLTWSAGPVATSLIQNLVASVLLLPLVATSLMVLNTQQWLLLLLLGVLCTAIAHTLFIYSLRHIKVVTAGVIAAGLEPVYGVSLAAVLLLQQPTANVLLGGSIILVAVIGLSVYRQVNPGEKP